MINFSVMEKNPIKFCLPKISQTLTHKLDSTNNLFKNSAVNFADK